MPYLLFFTISILTGSTAFGQFAAADSTVLAAAQQQAIALYTNALREKPHLYNGHEYIPHDRRIKIHPYFNSDTLQSGSITYNGLSYDRVLMLYDIVRDELAIQLPRSPYRARPHSEQVTSFSLGPYQFKRITGDSLAGVRTGFYQILYDGKIQFLARHIKTVQEDLSSGVYRGTYIARDRYFIYKDGTYHEIRQKRSVFALFPDQKGPLRKYIRANHLKFKAQREKTITAIVKQYEKLTH
ncbi:hypothetical protein WBJ53_09565 [Spirosoma sp. SC4-14]|uniref:hypothetical protein n=1 Tax=Spirosoma sp. SC4-14 TaxID=3128900 RepID=UPI0030D232BC